MKIVKNDEIKVIRGKDKGKTGNVEAVFEKENRVLVAGINQFKRHRKGNIQGQKSEIVTVTKPLPVSNVMLLCPKCHETSRVGFVMEKDKKKRVCKKCGGTF